MDGHSRAMQGVGTDAARPGRKCAGLWVTAAALMLSPAPAAHAQRVAAPPAPSAPQAAGAAIAWKQLYDDGQTTYYVDAAGLPSTGASDVTSLLEYKVPQVIGGSQVWSIVTHMKVRCDENRMVTSDNTLFASKMGTGPVIEAQPANDSWHAPIPGTLGGLVWGAACKP